MRNDNTPSEVMIHPDPRGADQPLIERLVRFCGVGMIVMPAMIGLVVGVSWIAGAPVQTWHLYGGLVLWLGSCWWAVGGRIPARTVVGALVGQLALLALCMGAAGQTLDDSFDGLWYHQEGVIRAVEGWNPVYDPTMFPPEALPRTAMLEIALRTYAKGPWMYAAAIVAATGAIEMGKAFNLVLILASLALSVAALDTFTTLSRSRRLWLAVLCACNPISLNQSFSYMIDGQVASLLVCLIALLVLAIRRWDRVVALGLLATIMVLSNTKQTAAVYLAIFLAGALGWLLLRREWPALRRLVLVGVAGGALALVIGANPYITNTVHYGNPFYPAIGTDYDVLRNQRPADFIGMNRVTRLVRSLLAPGGNQKGTEVSQLKVPFSITLYGDLLSSQVDQRLGGFGPLFSGALLIVVALVVVGGRDWRRAAPFAAASAVILASVLATPEGWWARLAPQTWLIPLVAARYALSDRRAYVERLGLVLLAVLTINAGLIGGRSIYRTYRFDRYTQMTLAPLAREQRVVAVSLGAFQRSYRLRLRNAGVATIETTQLLCPAPVLLAFARLTYGAGICPDPPAPAEQLAFTMAPGLTVTLDQQWSPDLRAGLRWVTLPAQIWIEAEQAQTARLTLSPGAVTGFPAGAPPTALLQLNRERAQALALTPGTPVSVELALHAGTNIIWLRPPRGVATNTPAQIGIGGVELAL